MDTALALMMGLSLAAVCGLRAFLPLFVASGLAHLGKVELSESFSWLAELPALIAFGTAVFFEILADKLPGVDHLLDLTGTIVKPTAATIVMSSMIVDFDPLVGVVLSLLSGGVVAGGLHVLKAKARLMSSAFTGTFANPVLSLIEDVAAFFGALLAWLFPLLGLLALTMLIIVLYRYFRRRKQLPVTSDAGVGPPGSPC